MHVYHYAPYEVSALRRLMGKHGTREEEVDALLRAEVFVDLYRVVKQSVLVGEPRYSLKNVEHLHRAGRAGNVATAGDEASQVSLANVVGMSRATRNIVLLGDQMQLAQPLKGSRPGESGRSALGYLLGHHRTIRDALGVFLKTSWRMHPEVCRVVSEAVYEGRLEADPANATRVVRVPARGAKEVTREAGVVFVPVAHEGNAQSSEEEVDAICKIVDELLGRELVEKVEANAKAARLNGGAPSSRRKRAARTLTAGDILVVAPYNVQVRALRAALPSGVRVGSVDKFQGQEARVAIVSMCASSGECVARGVEFLFSVNPLNVALSRAQSLAIVVGSPH